jgi:hypothetical protein
LWPCSNGGSCWSRYATALLTIVERSSMVRSSPRITCKEIISSYAYLTRWSHTAATIPEAIVHETKQRGSACVVDATAVAVSKVRRSPDFPSLSWYRRAPMTGVRITAPLAARLRPEPSQRLEKWMMNKPFTKINVIAFTQSRPELDLLHMSSH